jgi:hypothetical protein
MSAISKGVLAWPDKAGRDRRNVLIAGFVVPTG